MDPLCWKERKKNIFSKFIKSIRCIQLPLWARNRPIIIAFEQKGAYVTRQHYVQIEHQIIRQIYTFFRSLIFSYWSICLKIYYCRKPEIEFLPKRIINKERKWMEPSWNHKGNIGNTLFGGKSARLPDIEIDIIVGLEIMVRKYCDPYLRRKDMAK